MEKIDAATREQVTEFFPSALKKAFGSYHTFMDQEIPTDTKKFSDYHAAAKVAASHIELLFKMAKWAEIDPAPAVPPELSGLIASAISQTNQYRSAEVPTDHEEIP